ncbi:beta-1,4-galactosyltransferase galt-1, partial [Biomphalaria glabrata]
SPWGGALLSVQGERLQRCRHRTETLSETRLLDRHRVAHSSRGITYHGQKLVINDCVYRNRGASRYVAIQDTDEFLIPHQHDSWTELIGALNKEFELSSKSLSEQLGTYILQSTFYQDYLTSLQWEIVKEHFSVSEEDFQMFERYSLKVFSHLKRLKTHFVGERQKSIVRPETVLFNDVHTPNRNRPGIASVMVSVDLALVHHHRRWSSTQGNIVDPTSLKFKDRVLSLINQTLSFLS